MQPRHWYATAMLSTSIFLHTVDRPLSCAETTPVGLDELVQLDLWSDDAEVIDVVQGDSEPMAYVVAPGGNRGEHSALNILKLVPRNPGADRPEKCVQTGLVDLGPGEATSVAGLPGGRGALCVQKDPHRPDTAPGSLLLVHGERISDRRPTGPGPDSIAVSPDGRIAIVACEAQPPERSETEGADSPGSIDIFQVNDPTALRLVARVPGDLLATRLHEAGAAPPPAPEDVEPELVAVAPGSRLALVTLQEQSAVAVLDLAVLLTGSWGNEENGHLRLRDLLAAVVLLPGACEDSRGRIHGRHPDGIAIDPCGELAITANEAHPGARELQGISILDLRSGPRAVRLVASHDILSLDSSLEGQRAPRARAGGRPTLTRASRRHRIPRLDPEGVAIARNGQQVLAAIAIERAVPGEDAGSVLLLDVSACLSGGQPWRIARVTVGRHAGARPETLEFTPDGSRLLVASERDGGTVTILEVLRTRVPARWKESAATLEVR